jgi:hypothetical protein
MSSADAPQSNPPQTGLPPWLVRALSLLAFGMVTNWLSDVLHPLAFGALVAVAAVVYGMAHVDATAPITRVLPRVFLCLSVAGASLAVVTPVSWTGPISVASVVLVTCAALGARDRATALTSLGGLSIFTAGLIVVSEGMSVQGTAGKVGSIVLGSCAASLGLLYLRFRRDLFGSDGITAATLRAYPRAWCRAGALGILAVPMSFRLGDDGHLLAAILVAIAGLSWLGMTMVFVFTERRDALAGAMLAVCGAAVTGLSLLAFHGQEFLGGTIAITAGVAMLGGGLSLLESTGSLDRLTNLFKPEQQANSQISKGD